MNNKWSARRYVKILSKILFEAELVIQGRSNQHRKENRLLCNIHTRHPSVQSHPHRNSGSRLRWTPLAGVRMME